MNNMKISLVALIRWRGQEVSRGFHLGGGTRDKWVCFQTVVDLVKVPGEKLDGSIRWPGLSLFPDGFGHPR